MKTSLGRRGLSLLLTFLLCLSLVPAALAADTEGDYKIAITNTAPEIEVGGKVTLNASVTNNGAADTSRTVTWSTADTSTIDLDAVSGEVTGRAAGTATVEASCEVPSAGDATQTTTISTTCTVTVKAAPPPTVTFELNKTTLSLEEGKTEQLTATYKENGSAVSGKSVTWNSDDNNVATVNSATGLVSAVKRGTTVITATCEGKKAQCTVTVTAPPATSATIAINARDSVTLEPPRGTSTMTVTTNPANVEVKWGFTDEDGEHEISETDVIALSRSGNVWTVTGKKPGKLTIYAYVGDGTGANQKTKNITVEVSGLRVDTTPIEVMVNDDEELPVPEVFGAARGYKYEVSDPYYARVVEGTKVRGFIPTEKGKEIAIVVSDANGNYKATIPLTVVSNPTTTITYPKTLKSGEALPFTSLSKYFNNQLNGKVVSVSGLRVPTNQGTLYYRYGSEAEPGAGVASRDTYYRGEHVTGGRRDLEDVTFVVKPTYMGGQVTIEYSAVIENGETVSCSIILNVEGESGASAGVSLTTKYNTPVRFSANEFDRVCKERTGSRLSYVAFSLPNERQGTLYTNYVSEGNYGSLVQLRTQYSLRQLDDIWFVPAPGFQGTATVYYTARSVGTPGVSYSGQVNITVGPEDGVGIGGLSYEIVKGGAARFDDVDFNDYCRENLDSGQTLSFIQFDSLPGDGVLYYDYRSSTNTGSRASVGTTYYYGTRTPRIDRLAFVPNPDFVGTVRIPFTGQTVDGTRFSGNVEINVQGGTGSGDIYYTCVPGRSVSFDDSHFNRLCRDITGSTLNYIEFQSLPSSASGTLYINSSAARINTRYRNGSSSPRIDNLSFRAASSFSGTVDIPFKGTATNGATFDGVVTIGTTSAGTDSGNIRYTTDSKSAAVFDRDDFDDMSRWETDRDISSVRFEVPSSSEGSLYRNYRSSSSQGTRISSTTSISASELDRVAFIPASGYTGTVYINFKGTAASGGGTFDGQVEIEVGRAPADVTASYSTRTEPVRLSSGDLSRRGYTLSSVRFTSMPPTTAGYLYYQYVSPTRYGSQVNTGTTYQASGGRQISELYFVPRAGYSGTVSIPYTGTNSNGSTFEGEVLVTVSPGYRSSYFNDMDGYSQAQQMAVDYLYDHNITRGLTTGQYGPESHIRRGDFARMIYQAFEFSPSSTANAFYDVPSDVYYAEAVNALYARGIVSGTGGGYFSPNSALTRQDAICMVQRAMRTVGWSANDGYSSALTGYSDGNSVSGYAQGAMSFAVQRGYLPITGGRLSPTQPLTRVDMAEIIHRVLTY